MERETEQGFTFFEIMIALAIISLLTALSVRPMKGYIRRMEFRSNSQNIKHLVQTAQSRAMANPNVHIGVYFDKASKPNRVLLFQDIIADNNYDAAKDSSYMAPVVFKPGIVIKSVPNYPDDEIVFRGDGSAWKSLKVILAYAPVKDTLKDTLDVLASTGRVRVAR